MKKIILIALAAAMLMLAFVACEPRETLEGKTPEEAIELISKTMEQDDGLAYKSTCTGTGSVNVMNMFEYTVELEMDFAAKKVGEGEDATVSSTSNVKTSYSGTGTAEAGSVDISTVIVDGTVYVTYSDGEDVIKYKTTVEALEDADDLGAATNNAADLIDWEKIAELENVTIEKNDEGKFEITVESITADVINDMVSSVMGGMGGAGSDSELGNITDLEFVITANFEGFCEAIDMSFTLDIEGTDASFDYHFEFEKLGADFNIEAPKDAEEYEDIKDIFN